MSLLSLGLLMAFFGLRRRHAVVLAGPFVRALGLDRPVAVQYARWLGGTLRADLGVTILYVSHEFGAVERFVERIVLVRGGIVFDGPPSDLPGVWHDPSHTHA